MTVALAMYISVMIGGGMLYIDDKARGVHEGYLVTPITKLELVFGLNIAGAIKAVLSGISLTVIGSLIAGLGVVFHPHFGLLHIKIGRQASNHAILKCWLNLKPFPRAQRD